MLDQAHMSSLFENSTEGISLTNGTGNIVMANPAAEKMFGYSALELKNHITTLFTEDMFWDNYGEWHIDHKISFVNFPNNTHTSVINKLSNLQPLWATTREINGVLYQGNLNKNKY